MRLLQRARRRVFSLAVVSLTLLPNEPASAHHSFYASYREDEQITVQGTLDRVVYRNPHSYVYVLVSERGKQALLWVVECGTPDQVRRHQSIIDTLKPGDGVIVTGSPGRDPGDHRLRLRSIVRSDA